MSKKILNVEGMSCEHCVRAITNAVKGLPGINSVNVDLKGKKVELEIDEAKADLTKVKEAIEEEGYNVK